MTNQLMTTAKLATNISLDMIQIPGGSFMMGSPNTERATFKDARPQHQVTVASFLMGKYPVTQAQWRAVAAMPQVKIDLDPNPSYFDFKGDNRPVERISWFDVMEFCARLSAYTGQIYTLPSEAQWEYACRAGTTTPFYFGETLTADLANYDGSDSEPEGFYREETTEVGNFLPNAFGLYDMHGNVLEWCLDHYHDSYNGAPNDGSAWVDTEAEENKPRIIRGGSWSYYPWLCRCDCRSYDIPDDRYNRIGFRVVSVPPSTLR